eukprot:scaffold931_cov383-Prasinococcus_capsulatus_cf.AAC.17
MLASFNAPRAVANAKPPPTKRGDDVLMLLTMVPNSCPCHIPATVQTPAKLLSAGLVHIHSLWGRAEKHTACVGLLLPGRPCRQCASAPSCMGGVEFRPPLTAWAASWRSSVLGALVARGATATRTQRVLAPVASEAGRCGLSHARLGHFREPTDQARKA